MGVVMVSSSGNNGWNKPHFPSDLPEVISVGGTDSENDIYGFSNYGSPKEKFNTFAPFITA